MESKEILKEFAGKLAGLSAAAKVVAIAGAVSAYSGTGHAAAESTVKAENRITAGIASTNSKVASDSRKSEEVSAKKEEPAKTQVSEAAVKTLLASKEEVSATAKVAATPKANIAPSIQEKVNIYEPKKESVSKPKYDTRYYQAPGTAAKTSERTSRSSRSYETPSYSSYSSYNEPTAPSYVAATSDNDAFGENASSSRSTSVASRSSRRSYRGWGRTHTNSDSYGSASKDTDSKSKTDGIGRNGVSTGSKGNITSTASQSTGFANFSGFGGGDSSPSAPKNDAKTEKALKIAEAIEKGEKKLVSSTEEHQAFKLKQEIDQGKKKLVDADTAERIQEQQANIARAEHEVQQLRNELQTVRAENLELKGRPDVQQQAENLQILPQIVAGQGVVPPPPGVEANAAGIVDNTNNGAVPPPPGVPPPPPGAVPPPPGAVAQNGNGIPLPPGVPPPPGVPAAPRAPQAPGVGGAVQPAQAAQVDYDSIIKEMEEEAKERERKLKKEQEEQRKRRAKLDKMEGNVPGLLKLYIDECEGAGWEERTVNANSRTYENRFHALIKRFRNEKSSYAFYDTIVRTLEDIKKETDENRLKGYKLLMSKCCEDFVMAVLYFEGTMRDVLLREWKECKDKESISDFIPDRYAEGKYFELLAACFEKCGLTSRDAEDLLLVRLTDRCLDDACLTKKDITVRRAMFPEVAIFIVSELFGDPKTPEARKILRRIESFEAKVVSTKQWNEIEAANKGVVYGRNEYIYFLHVMLTDPHFKKAANSEHEDEDKDVEEVRNDVHNAILKVFDLKKWYDTVDAAKKATDEFKRGHIDEDGVVNKKGKVVVEAKTDLDDAKKKRIFEILDTLMKGFMVSKLKPEFRPGDLTRRNGLQMTDLRNELINQILKKTKSPQVIAFRDEMERRWNEKTETSLRLAGNRLDETPEEFVNGTNGTKDYFNKIVSPFKTEYKKKLDEYDRMLFYPIIVKLGNAVKISGTRLQIAFDDNESKLMIGNTKLIAKALEVVLKSSITTNLILEGKWLGTFLNGLPLKEMEVSRLTLAGAVFSNLVVLNGLDTLKSVTFRDVSLCNNALATLKLSDAEVNFINVKSTETLYKGEGILKRLADMKVKLKFVGKNPWAIDGVRPVDANPAQGGLPGLRGIGGGNGNVAGNVGADGLPQLHGIQGGNAAQGGNQQGFQFPGLKKTGALNAGEKRVPKGHGEVQDRSVYTINQIRSKMKALPANTVLGDEFFRTWKEIWESDGVETIEADLPGAMFESRANVKDFFDTAVKIANEKGKPLVLIGRFETPYRWDADNRGHVARALLKLKSPLKIASTSQYGTDVAMLNELLAAMANLKHENMELKSVELDRIVSFANCDQNRALLTNLGDLGVEMVIFSHLDKAAMEQREDFENAQGQKGHRIVVKEINAWEKEFLFSANSDAWKHLFKKIKVVDLRNNDKISSERLSDLETCLAAIKNERVAGNADGVPGAQQPEKIALQSILLPDNADERLASGIKDAVDELKRN